MGADGFVRVIAVAAFDAIVDGELAHGAESFVVEGGNTESGPQFFVEFAEVNELRGEGGELDPFIGEQEFLVPGVPQPAELALDHDGGEDGHLEMIVGGLAKLGATTVFFNADDSAGAANRETQGSESVHLLFFEAFVDVPHRSSA